MSPVQETPGGVKGLDVAIAIAQQLATLFPLGSTLVLPIVQLVHGLIKKHDPTNPVLTDLERIWGLKAVSQDLAQFAHDSLVDWGVLPASMDPLP